MKTTRIVIMVIVLTMGSLTNAKSQFESSSPSIPKQEYFNPAFNAYKNYSSLNLMSREQWVNGVRTAPKMLGVNLFVPSKKRGLGFGANLISEDIGLRSVNTFQFLMSKGIQIGANSYMSLGIGVGAEQEAYNRNKMELYFADDIINVKMSQENPVVSMGLMMLLRNYFIGISSNLRINDQDFDFTYLTGFDFNFGRIFILNPDFVFRTTVVGKYYKETRYSSNKGVVTDEFVPPVVDWSVSCLLYDKVWLGAGIRFEQAATIMANVRVARQINLGYKFEMGIGNGLNRFNSQGVYLTYNFRKRKRSFTGYKYYEKVFSRSTRQNRPLSEYLY